jgi:hypothetical protein
VDAFCLRSRLESSSLCDWAIVWPELKPTSLLGRELTDVLAVLFLRGKRSPAPSRDLAAGFPGALRGVTSEAAR